MRRKPQSDNPDLLKLPRAAGQAIVQSGAMIGCPLMGTDSFARFCKARGLDVDAKRLLRLERLALFQPVFRVQSPLHESPPFRVPISKGNNWFRQGWAWDATRPRKSHPVPSLDDDTQEAYYSIFQIDSLELVLSELTLTVGLDEFLLRHRESGIDWNAHGKRWMKYADMVARPTIGHDFRAATGFLCQYISTAYFPRTLTDQRTIRVGSPHYSDDWIQVGAFGWDWHREAAKWNPKSAEKLFDLNPRRLEHAYRSLAIAQEHRDPLEHWYQLVQFVSLDERERLKGDALRAETIRQGALMLRMLHKDLYGSELPHPNEVTGTIITHIPELEVRKDVRRYLEFVVNRFGLNPQPKLSLILEGYTEKIAVEQILERYFGFHPGKLGIEIIVLGGLDTATGAAEDRFRAILRLVDYLHHHQTLTFMVLDNERYAKKLKAAAHEAKSIHHGNRFVTRPEYVKIWKTSFEFDNFSDTELGAALGTLCGGKHRFNSRDLAACRKNPESGAALKHLFTNRTQQNLSKVDLTNALLEILWKSAEDRGSRIRNRPIVRVLSRVLKLASRNPFPVMQESWEINQRSKYLGKKRGR